MKKVIVLCAAFTIAAVTQAASISWAISNVYGADGKDKIALGSSTAYLFVAANTTDVDLKTTSLDAVKGVLAKGDLTALEALSVTSAKNTAVGGWGGASGLQGFSSGSLDAFAVIIDGTDPKTAENYFIVSGGELKNASFTSATGIKMLAWGDQTKFTQGEGKWTSAKGGGDVPEPTSGMLLLLGLAGLALRRKQK